MTFDVVVVVVFVVELQDVCDLLNVDVTILLDALTSRTVNTMKEAVKTDLSAVEVSAQKF